MSEKNEIRIVAGEPSGDLHAAPVVRAVREQAPDVAFFGIGGERMRAAGVETLYDTEAMAVMGLSEVLRRLPFFKRAFREVLRQARRRRPAAAVLVDYPGFNLRLAAKLHAAGIKVVYYICPQVWAWNRSRIPHMARIVDRLITIFPFEAEHFEGTGLRVDFAGHPLAADVDRLRSEPEKPLPWAGRATRLALLPGSRRHEIERILPPMAQAAARLRGDKPDLAALVAAPGAEQAELARAVLRDCGIEEADVQVVEGVTRHVLRQATAAMVASGTATIEAALFECPMVVVYRVSPLTYLFGRLLIRVPDIGMVNIVAGRRICPELVQHTVTPRVLARAAAPLLKDTSDRRRMIENLRAVRARLGAGRPAETAAGIILEELQ